MSDINPDFQNLEDFTLNDLVRLHGELRTNGNITQAKTKEEAYEILKTLYLVSNSREENKYTVTLLVNYYAYSFGYIFCSIGS